MSWDIFVIASERPPTPATELPDEESDSAEEGQPLGTCETVRRKLSVIAPKIDWSDPAWGVLLQDDYSIEFNMGEADPCTSMMLHVRGSAKGDELFELLRKIFEVKGWYGYDTTQSQWFHLGADPAKGFSEFTTFRDRVTEKLEFEGKKPFWRRFLGL